MTVGSVFHLYAYFCFLSDFLLLARCISPEVVISPLMEAAQPSNNVQYYKFNSDKHLTWQQANNTCTHHGMSLPTPTSNHQLDRLGSLIEESAMNTREGFVFLGVYSTHQCYVLKRKDKQRTRTSCSTSELYACNNGVFGHHFFKCPMDLHHVPWAEARAACLQRGSHLKSSDEMEWHTCLIQDHSSRVWVDDPYDYSYYWLDGTVAHMKESKRLKMKHLHFEQVSSVDVDLSDFSDVMYVMMRGDKKWLLVSDKAKVMEFVCQKDIDVNQQNDSESSSSYHEDTNRKSSSAVYQKHEILENYLKHQSSHTQEKQATNINKYKHQKTTDILLGACVAVAVFVTLIVGLACVTMPHCTYSYSKRMCCCKNSSTSLIDSMDSPPDYNDVITGSGAAGYVNGDVIQEEPSASDRSVSTDRERNTGRTTDVEIERRTMQCAVRAEGIV